MLVWLSTYLTQFDNGFAVFQYITVRGIFSIITALLISLAIGPYMIRRLNSLQIGQVVRDDGPKSHFSKAGTPTMCGSR